MLVSRKITRIGDSQYLLLTKDHRTHLGLDEENEEVMIKDEIGKHGPYLSIWVKPKEKNKK